MDGGSVSFELVTGAGKAGLGAGTSTSSWITTCTGYWGLATGAAWSLVTLKNYDIFEVIMFPHKK